MCLCELISSSIDIECDFELVDNDIHPAVAHPVEADRSINDLVKCIRRGAIARVIDCYCVGIHHASSKYPMPSIMNVENYDIVAGKVAGDGRPADETNELNTERVDRCPHKEILAHVAVIGFEPGVHGGGSEGFADAGECHCS